MEATKYDVFISYSRKDYVENDAIIPGNPISAIIELFDKNDVSYWIDKEGIYGGLEFVEVISDAIASSKMLVFVSSIHSNDSIYTAGEIHEAVGGKKLVIPVRIDDCPYNKKIRLLLSPLDFIDYKAQPNTALPELLRTVNREKERIENEEANARKKQTALKAKNEIKEKAKEFHALAGQQDHILKELYAKNKLIGNTTKHCPVCGNIAPIQSPFCGKCSWQFPKLYSLDGSEIPIYDETQLVLARTHWQSLNNVDKLHEDNKKLEEEKSKIDAECQKLRVSLDDLIRREEEAQTTEKTFTVGSVSFKMIRVEGGRFQMGSPSDDHDAYANEKPQHWVMLSDFYIGETVVTQALWKEVMGFNPSKFNGEDNPVESVDWDDCQKFIKKLSAKTNQQFRLPTEAEWEYAARGGNKSKNYKYAGGNTIGDVAWFNGNSDSKTHQVKNKQPNELGLFDMSGNVYERCLDWYSDTYYKESPMDNPRNLISDTSRVLRGGSWLNRAKHCRVADRYKYDPSVYDGSIGFRLVLALPLKDFDMAL